MKYNIVHSLEPSKHTYSQEELDELLNKAISLLIDDLMLNDKVGIGE